MGYSREELAARRLRQRRRRRARLRGVAVLAGIVGAVGLAAAWVFRDDPEPGSAAARSPGVPASTPAETTPVREPPLDETVTIAAVGDIAMGREGFLPPGGPGSLFAQVGGELRGDVVLGNLEQALTDEESSKCGETKKARRKRKDCFAFRTPPAFATALEDAGFTVLNLANNHAYDYGQAGLEDTVSALEEAELAHTGLVGELPRVRKRPVRVVVLGFGFYPTGESVLDVPRARQLVREADGWADVVVVTFHGGAEGNEATRVPRGMETYLGERRGDSRAFSHAVVDAGADLVVGHGPHVLRGMEWYEERLIAYSMGNFAGNHTFRAEGLGAVSGILRVTLRGDGAWVKGRLVPTALVGNGQAVPDPAEAAHGAVRRLSRRDFGAGAVQVLPTGELLPPGA